MLDGRRFQVVDLPQLCPDVSICLLLGQLVLVVVADVVLLAALALDLEHVGYVDLVRLQALNLVLLLLCDALVDGVFHDDAVELGQVDVLGLRVVGQRNGVLGLGALAELGHLLVLVAIVVVGLGEAVGEVVQVLVCADGLQQLVLLRGLMVDIDAQLASLRPDGREQLPRVRPVGGIHLQHALDGRVQLLRVIISDLRVSSLDDLLVEAVHVLSAEGRLQRSHLVDHAAEAPDIGLGVIGLVLPHLRTGVVRRAGLGV